MICSLFLFPDFLIAIKKYWAEDFNYTCSESIQRMDE